MFSSSGAEQLKTMFASCIKCDIGSWPMDYLGYEIFPGKRRKTFWAPFIKKVKVRLASWKNKCLDKAGKMVLIKSVVNSLHVYWMNMALLPKGVLNFIDSLRRGFFWNSVSNCLESQKKLHLICWDTLCKPRDKGGLGLFFCVIRM